MASATTKDSMMSIENPKKCEEECHVDVVMGQTRFTIFPSSFILIIYVIIMPLLSSASSSSSAVAMPYIAESQIIIDDFSEFLGDHNKMDYLLYLYLYY